MITARQSPGRPERLSGWLARKDPVVLAPASWLPCMAQHLRSRTGLKDVLARVMHSNVEIARPPWPVKDTWASAISLGLSGKY